MVCKSSVSDISMVITQYNYVIHKGLQETCTNVSAGDVLKLINLVGPYMDSLNLNTM